MVEHSLLRRATTITTNTNPPKKNQQKKTKKQKTTASLSDACTARGWNKRDSTAVDPSTVFQSSLIASAVFHSHVEAAALCFRGQDKSKPADCSAYFAFVAPRLMAIFTDPWPSLLLILALYAGTRVLSARFRSSPELASPLGPNVSTDTTLYLVLAHTLFGSCFHPRL